jgi:hypothetical protein
MFFSEMRYIWPVTILAMGHALYASRALCFALPHGEEQSMKNNTVILYSETCAPPSFGTFGGAYIFDIKEKKG